MIATYSTSQSCGDIIYAMPLMRHVFETQGRKAVVNICATHSRYAKGQTVNTYNALHRLLASQEYIEQVNEITEAEIGASEFQLDKYRRTEGNLKRPIPETHFIAQGFTPPIDMYRPWVVLEGSTRLSKSIAVSATGKYGAHGYDVPAILNRLNNAFFVGLESEWHSFASDLPFKYNNDLLDVAQEINTYAYKFVGEQSAPLTIAQGLGLACQVFRHNPTMNTMLPNTKEYAR